MVKLTIGYDAKRLFNNLTGLGNYSRTLVHNVQKAVPLNDYVLFSEKVRNNPDTEQFTNSSKYNVVGKRGFGRKLWRIWSIRKDIKRLGVNIYHGLSHDLPFGAKPRGVKYIVTIHDVCFKTFPVMFAKTERWIYHCKYKNAIKKADKIIAISQSTKNDIIKYYPNVDISKIEVIYQALNPVYYNLESIESERTMVERYGIKSDYILYVGSINSRKNLMGIIKAYEVLPEELRLPLVVIGSGRKYKVEVEAYSQVSGIDEYVTYLDNVTLPENLRAFYRCAKMLVYPSFYEGFGLPVAESLLCQTPVITSNISSLAEAGGEFAIYADPFNHESIADKISDVIKNYDLAKETAKKGREFCIKNFDPQKLTQQVLNLYENV